LRTLAVNADSGDIKKGGVDIMRKKKPAIPFSKATKKFLKSDAGLPHVIDADLTAAGTVIATRLMAKQDPDNPAPRTGLLRFCQYLERRGYGVCAEDIFDKVLKMGDSRFTKWIEDVFAEYIPDHTGLIDWVIHGKGGERL
jgi:hypothetical protein